MKSNQLETLKKPTDFNKLLKNAKNLDSLTFKIKFFPNDLKKFRYAIAVNKKNFPKAVQRNLIKRQVREYIRKISLLKHVDMIVIVKSNYPTNTYSNNYKIFNDVYNLIPNT